MRQLPFAVASALALVFVATACGGPAGQDSGSVVEKGKGGGAAQCDPSQYPCGPYGYQPGSVIENLSFVGRRDSNQDGKIDAQDDITTLKLSDYFQNKQIYALAISATAEWCNPCRMEQPDVESMFQNYQAHGNHVAFLEASIQKNDGSPSDMDTVDSWRNTFGITFDLVADPTLVLQPYYDINAFPMNMVVRTKDMTIVWQGNGYAPQDVKTNIDAILAHP